jgi:hypothetical protein
MNVHSSSWLHFNTSKRLNFGFDANPGPVLPCGVDQGPALRSDADSGPAFQNDAEGQKSLGPLKISLEMAHKVICPQKKNNLPHF